MLSSSSLSDFFRPLSTQIRNFFSKDFLNRLGDQILRIRNEEEARLAFLSQFMIATAAITFVSFTFLGIRASYGRYSAQSVLSKFAIPARLAWFLQELPSLIVPLFPIWQIGLTNLPIANIVVLVMFILHYAQRTLLYPFLIRHGKPTPIHLFLLGFLFCSWNGYIQGYFHAKYAAYPKDHLWTFGALFGIPLFLLGMFINLQADHILRKLRRPGEKGYKIPYGGMFEYVSGANFFGEIVEWTGYALFAQTHSAMAFALFTAANTIPRAREHHSWYLHKFNNYPADRTAIIPFLY